MFYFVKVNLAIAALGFNPNDLKPEFRQLAQDYGKAAGYSPEEAALMVCSQLPLMYQMQLNPAVARGWIRAKKVNSTDPQIEQAIFDLRWDGLFSSR